MSSEFKLTHLTEYTKAAMLAELRRVSDLIPEGPLTAKRFNSCSRVSYQTICRHFGTWRSALKEAELEHRHIAVPSDHKSPQAAAAMSDDAVLEALRQVASALNRRTLTLRDIKTHSAIGQRTLAKRWGSTHAAIEAAGLQTCLLGNRYSDEECFKNMASVWTHYGRPPQHREMSNAPSVVGPKAYVARFGTWRKALSAFVEQLDAGEAEDTVPRTELKPTKVVGSTGAAELSQVRDKRAIPWGLRFKVMHRDRFRCTLCGDSPSINLQCKLHVDHVVPWSKGGPADLSNLRSLCEQCNIGRGNRFID